jgi:hypothetical protein
MNHTATQLAVLLTGACLLASCRTVPGTGAAAPTAPAAAPAATAPAPSAPPTPAAVLPPALRYSGDQSGKTLGCPLEGELVATGTGPDGQATATIRCSARYWYGGDDPIVQSYELVVGGLDRVVAAPGPLKADAPLGVAGAAPWLSARLPGLNPWAVRSSRTKPVRQADAWWFSPDWLVPGNTQTLSFRPVDDLEAALADFYARWADEGETAGARGTVLHYFPELDRIRVPVRLSQYPAAAPASPGLMLVEQQLYQRPGLFVSRNLIPRGKDYDAVLWWQKDFDRYLANEYTLGTPLWLYCSIYALDHDQRQIVVCVRDFTLRPDEAIVAERLAEINGK